MRRLAILGVLVAVMASPADAQVRRRSNSGIPPGQLPPPGMCRVWYAGLPPGRQPRPTNCDEAERIASRDRNARVIYGDDAYARGNNAPYGNDRYGNDRYGNDRNRNDRYRSGRGYGVNSVAYDNGYRDGLEKGIEDAHDRDSYDPVRHSRYRSADRGYDRRYGTREQYKLAYRDGFEAGYDEAYRRNGGSRSGSRGANRRPF